MVDDANWLTRALEFQVAYGWKILRPNKPPRSFAVASDQASRFEDISTNVVRSAPAI